MRKYMGHFGETPSLPDTSPKPVMPNGPTIEGMLKFMGGMIGVMVMITAGITIMEKLENRNHYRPDASDQIEHYRRRIKDLSKKLSDGSISSDEANELHQIIYSNNRRGLVASLDVKESPTAIKNKLDKFFDSEGR